MNFLKEENEKGGVVMGEKKRYLINDKKSGRREKKGERERETENEWTMMIMMVMVMMRNNRS